MSTRPDLTVAAVIERGGRFLFVEERVSNRMVFNQPAGHVERGEQLIHAVVRETLEETAWSFRPDALVGVYLWEQPEKQKTFLRFAFCGSLESHDPHRALDDGIERTVWMTREQMLARSARLRSPMVARCVDDYLAGRRYPLGLITTMTADAHAAASDSRIRALNVPINRLA